MLDALVRIRRTRLAIGILALTLTPGVPGGAHCATTPVDGAPADTVVAHADTTAAAPEQPYLPLTYSDSLTSVNTHCIVSGSHLNERIAPVYVNSEPVGFC